MRRGIAILAACLAAASAPAAETAAERGKRLVSEALQALGGPAFLQMRDRTETGRAFSFYHSEVSGLSLAKIYTRYLAAAPPNRVAVREREAFFSKISLREEDAAVLITEDGAWQLTYRGALPLDDERYQNFQDATRHSIFYILRERLNEPELDYYWMGSDVVDNRPVDIVDITDAARETVTVYLSQDDHLPIRQSYKRRNPQFKDFDTEVSLFARYRDVGKGVKWPFNIRRDRNGDKVYELYSDSVEIDKSLTDDLFNLPANLKILPKPK
jgi:hypothetical protein